MGSFAVCVSLFFTADPHALFPQGNSGNDGPPGPPGERVCRIILLSKVGLFERNLLFFERSMISDLQLCTFFFFFSGFARASGTNRFSRTKGPSCESDDL